MGPVTRCKASAQGFYGRTDPSAHRPPWFAVVTQECSLCTFPFPVVQKHCSRKSKREAEMRTSKKREEVQAGQCGQC